MSLRREASEEIDATTSELPVVSIASTMTMCVGAPAGSGMGHFAQRPLRSWSMTIGRVPVRSPTTERDEAQLAAPLLREARAASYKKQ
jgi:hypothetical protein